jgi:hypothetical protein
MTEGASAQPGDFLVAQNTIGGKNQGGQTAQDFLEEGGDGLREVGYETEDDPRFQRQG